MAVYPKSKADVDKMSGSLNRIVEEDPSLKLTREPNTGEMLFTGLGDAHLDVTIDKIQRKFGAEIALQIPKVPYKETITTLARSEYKHKKQTGGHGQYGHVLLRLEPLGRGEGAQFAEEIVGGAVPREYIASVEKGVNKAINEGVVVGYPVVDVKVVLYDGSYHDVDSSGISFEIAASHAFREGVNSGAPALLEPILKMSITVPDAFTGDIIGDLNSKRGRILGMIPQDGKTVIEAEVPHAEVLRYSIDLRSMTQGRGSYIAEFDHYEEVPQHISQKVQDQIKETAKA
jgi:elongation factor G